MNYLILTLSFVILISSRLYVKINSLYLAVMVDAVFFWVLIYGVLAPVLAMPLDSPYLLYKEYYGVSSLLLTAFYLIFLLLVVKYFKSVKIIEINVESNFPIKIAFFSTLLFMVFWENHKYQKDIYSMLFLPAIMVAYCRVCVDGSYYVRLFLIHGLFFVVSSASGFLIDSKERMFSCLIFPVIARVVFLNFSAKLKFIILLVGVIFGYFFYFYASDVVRETRAQNSQVAISNSESGDERYLANIERISVIDGLSAAIFNENKFDPMRPNNRLWSIIGFIGQVGPDLFRRPNHAKESILLVGYLVSTDEVNIALTVPGHFLWSFGWVGMFLSMVIFWGAIIFILKKSMRLDKTLSLMFYFFFLSQVPRLESVGYSYVASLITALILYYLIFGAISIFVGVDE